MSGSKKASAPSSPAKRTAPKPAQASPSKETGPSAGDKRQRLESENAKKARERREREHAEKKAAAQAAANKRKSTAARAASEHSSEAEQSGESDDQDAGAHAQESDDSEECEELYADAAEDADRRLHSRTSKGDSGHSTSKKQVQARSSPASEKQAAASSSPASAETVSDFGHMPLPPAFCRDINPWVYMQMMRRVEGPVMEQANAAETQARLESIYTAIDIARPSGFNQARYKEAVQHFPAHLVEVTKKTKGAAQTFEKVTL